MLDPAPRWRKVLRDIWLHKARMFLVVPAIAAGLIGAGSVLNTWALVERATKEGFAGSKPPAATLTTEDVDGALLERVRAIPGIEAARGRRVANVGVRIAGRVVQGILFVGTDYDGRTIGLLKPEAGTWPPKDGTLVVERSSVDWGSVVVGEALAIVPGGGDAVPVPVSGIVRDVGVAPGWMEHVIYAFATPATLTQLGLPASLDQVQFTVRDRTLDQNAVRRIAWDVKAAIEATGRAVSDVDVPVPGEHIHTGQMNTLLYAQAAFGVLALMLGGFLVVNLMTAMLSGHVRDIGVMKTLGARPDQLAGMYLGFALILGLAATVLAVPLSIVIGRVYGAFKADLLNFEVTGYAIPVWVILVQVAVGAVMPVLTAAIPVTRGCRMSVASALRDIGIDGSGGESAPGRFLTRIGGVSRPMLFSLRNAFRRRQRMALTLTTLAMGGAVFLGAGNLRVSIRRAMDRAFASRQYDIALRVAAPMQAAVLEERLAAIPGVQAAEAWAGGSITTLRPDGTEGNPFTLTAPPLETRLLAPDMFRGTWLSADTPNGIVVGERFLAQEALGIGDTLRLMLDGRPSTWRVLGTVASTVGGMVAYARRDVVAGLRTGPVGGLVSTAVLKTDAHGVAAELELIQRIRTDLGRQGIEVATTSRTQESRRVTEDHLLLAANFLGVMAWLVIFVGGLGVASTMSLAVLERTREIGVLRAIGARPGSILTIVQVEGLVIGILSWLVAIPLSMPMSRVLASVFSRSMLRVPPTYVPESGAVLLWLGLVVGVSIVATLIPAWNATRVPTAAALAYE